MYEIEYLEDALQDIKALPKAELPKIRRAIETRLAQDPIGLGKPLRYSLKGHRRIRVGDYRVIYRIEEAQNCVVIVAIGHRKDIYED